MSKSIIVVGAGIVGVSTAIWLQREGHQVTLIDKNEPAAGASFGNAGVMATGSVVPVTVPGLIQKAPKLLFNSDQPLFLRWSYLPKLLPFLNKYLRHANSQSVDRISVGLHQLLQDTPDQHFALAEGTPAEKFIKRGDYLFVYENEEAYKADSYAWGVRKSRGVDVVELDKEALARYQPVTKDRFDYGVQCRQHGKVSDPGAYVKTLAEHFISEGGTFQKAELTGFDIENGECKSLKTEQGNLTADKYIVTTGAWSSAWAKALGVTVPMESERGYFIEFVNPSMTFETPMMVASGKFVVHSMLGRMRCSGVIEFGGLNKIVSKSPIALLKRQMVKLFPDLSYDYINEWLGHRPAPADSLPIIGESPNANNVILGYGHHHVGMSSGPKTGRWLAALASNKVVKEDLSVYAANRKV